jgi:signal transduction histidine kinase
VVATVTATATVAAEARLAAVADTDQGHHAENAPMRHVSDQVDGSTESRRAEDLYAEISQLAGGLAHEIRNPLSTMRLNLDLLAEDFRASESDRERRALTKIERVQRESVRLEGMLDDFLRYVRAGRFGNDLVLADLNATVEDIKDFCEPQSLQHGIVTRIQLDSNIPRLALHVDSLKQALLNLIRNAQQAMEDGGELMIRTRREECEAIVDIIDTGKGMTSDVIRRIFEPYYSTRPRGTGFGLPTTRRIIEAHGGTIEVQSTPGKGSQFTIRLPIRDASEEPH